MPLPYYSPPDANLATASEPVGVGEDGLPVERQEVADPHLRERFDDLLNRVGGPETLAALLRAIRDNTDSLEISADTINLNTDELEARSEAIRAAVAAFHAAFDGRDLASVASITNLRDQLSTLLTAIRDNTDTLEISAENINLNTDELEARTEAVRAAIATFEGTFTARDLASVASVETVRAAVANFQAAFTGRDLASVASITNLRDTLSTAIAEASDEAVVAAITAFRDSFTTRDLSTSALQQALLTELQKKANAPDPIMTRPTMEVRQREGLAFMASTGRVSLSTSGHFRATIRNPGTHTRLVYVQRLAIFASAGPVYGRIFINPTTGLPATATRPVNNSRVGNPTTSPIEVRADVSTGVTPTPLGGGIDSGIDLALGSGVRNDIQLAPLSIPPGVTLGINIPFTGAADVVLTGYWYEEAS